MEHIEHAQRLSGGTLPGWAPDDEGPEPGSIARSDAVSDEHRDADELRDPASPDPDATPGGTR